MKNISFGIYGTLYFRYLLTYLFFMVILGMNRNFVILTKSMENRNEMKYLENQSPSTKNQNWACDTRHYMKIANVFCPNVPFKCVFNKRQSFTNKCKNWRRHWSKSSNLMFISTSTTMKFINTFILWYWNTK